MSEARAELSDIRGIPLRLQRSGSGPALLFLEPHVGLWKADAFLAELARHFTVLTPSHPGFEESPVVDRFNSVDDLSYLYLDLIEQFDLRDVRLVGSSFGAWIAMAIAIKNSGAIRSLTLVDPVGAHFGGPEEEGVADIFSMSEIEFAQRGFADEALGRKNYPELTDEELLTSSRNREAAARFAWMPCMYDPKMAQRLYRIEVPTQVIWGEHDRITDRDYAEQMATAIPGASFHAIADAGHFPHIEQPQALVQSILAFENAAARSSAIAS